MLLRRKLEPSEVTTVTDESTVLVPDAETLMRRINAIGVMREFAEEEADVVRAIAGQSFTGPELVGALLEPTRRLCNRDGQPCSVAVLRSVMLSLVTIVAYDLPEVLWEAMDDMATIRPHSSA